MATPTDPSFGAGFDAAAFRQAITSTMEMGMAAGEDAATFFWKEEATYTYGGPTPYDLTAAPESVEQETKTVTIPVAVEFIPRATGATGGALADVDSPKAIITVMDTYIDQVRDADAVQFSGVQYDIDYIAPVLALFDVQFYQFFVSALDEA